MQYASFEETGGDTMKETEISSLKKKRRGEKNEVFFLFFRLSFLLSYLSVRNFLQESLVVKCSSFRCR